MRVNALKGAQPILRSADELQAFRQRRLGCAAEGLCLLDAGIGSAEPEWHATAAAGDHTAADRGASELRFDRVSDEQLAQDDRLVALALPCGDLVAPLVAEAIGQAPHRDGFFGVE